MQNVDERKISVVIPTWNRYHQTIDSFVQVLHDERVSGIYITDDASNDGSYEMIVKYFEVNDKVHVFRNEFNLDCHFNKNRSMQNAEGEWCILFDSDNTLTKEYLDALYAIPEWDEKTYYMPEFARPYFSAKEWSGLVVSKENASQYVGTHLMTNFNAMNLFINREEYLKVWDGSVNPHTSDSLFFSYCWLVAGNKILVTPNLEYDHFIDHIGKSGHYQNNQHKTGNFHNILLEQFKKLH